MIRKKFLIKASHTISYIDVVEAFDIESAKTKFLKNIDCNCIVADKKTKMNFENINTRQDKVEKWIKENPPIEVAINTYGDGYFSLHDEAAELLKSKMPHGCYSDCLDTGLCKCRPHDYDQVYRDDPRLIETVKSFENFGSSEVSEIEIEEIPHNAGYWIDQIDNGEHVIIESKVKTW